MPARLWFSPAGLPRLRQRAAQGWLHDVGQAALQAAASAPPATLEGLAAWIEASAVSHLLTGRTDQALATGDAVRVLLDREAPSDLSRALQIQAAVIGYDLCAQAWPRDQKDAIAGRLLALAHRLAGTDLSPDNPDNPFNNWWGVTHAAAGLAALCLRGEHAGADALLALSRDRIRTHLLNYGDRGHYYEGTGYGCYALSHWAPYVLAERHIGEFDPGALAPGIAWFGVTLLAQTVARPQIDDATGLPRTALGARLVWNDDGGSFPARGIGPLCAALAPEALRPALRGQLDRLNGPLGDRSAAAAGPGLLWTLLYTPDEAPPGVHPAPLPRFVYDQRTGLVLFRNRYQDADDTVVGVYAKTYHGGGHTHEDLGAWRWQGLGAAWAQGGGQAKPEAVFQCTVQCNGRPNTGRHGQVSYLSPGPDGSGGSVSLRLGPSAGVRRLDRHFLVDFSGAAGADTLVVVVDECMADEPSTWTWSLCFERRLECRIDADGRGFTLRDPHGGATCRATLLQPGTATLAVHEGPSTHRRFSDGSERTYAGARYLTATAEGREVTFAVAFTAQRGSAPVVRALADDAGLLAGIGDVRVRLARGKWFHGPLRLERT